MQSHSKILLCIKNRELLDVLSDFLKRENYAVEIYNGEYIYSAAKTIAERYEIPDIVFFEKDSAELLTAFKEHANLSKIPNILIIDQSSELLQINPIDRIDEFIIKPINPVELSIRLKTAFRIKKYREFLEIDAKNWEKKSQSTIDELSILKEYNKHIVDAFPMSIIIIDKNFKIQYVNENFLSMRGISTSASALNEKNLEEIFNIDFFNNTLKKEIQKSIYQHKTLTLFDLKNIFREQQPQNIFEISVISLKQYSDNPKVLLIINDITEKKKNEWRNHLVQELILHIQDFSEPDRILFAILTCVTAGVALGFSRAFVMLFDQQTGALEAKLGVGPMNQSDANQIWGDLSVNPKSLADYIQDYEKNIIQLRNKHIDILKNLRFQQEEIDDCVKKCFREKRAIKFEANSLNYDSRLNRFLSVGEFILAPLISNNKPLGIIIADNKYSYKKIDNDNIMLLSLFAASAAQSLQMANIYKSLKTKMQELDSTREKLLLSEKMATVGRLAVSISHEIRNPLTTIGGFASRILKSIKLGNLASIQSAAQIICAEVDNLENILSNIMDFSKSNVINKSVNRLKDIIENSIVILTSNIKENKILIEYVDDCNNVMINCDPIKLKQTFVNILKNSIEAIKQSQPVEPKIKIGVKIESGKIFICFSDNGCGIKEENLQNIFTPFFTTKETGTGLGMSIIKNIIDAHNGDIKINSIYGKFTEIKVELPVVEDANY